MKVFLAIGLGCALFAGDVTACTCIRPELSEAFSETPVVIEASVAFSKEEGNLERMHLNIQKVWKTDGLDLSVIEDSRGSAPCKYPLVRGRSYIIWAHRSKSFWSFLPWIKEALYTNTCTYTTTAAATDVWKGSASQAWIEEMRQFLDSRDLGKQPNKPSEPTR